MKRLTKVTKPIIVLSTIVLIVTAALINFILFYRIELTFSCSVTFNGNDTYLLISGSNSYKVKKNQDISLRVGNDVYRSTILEISNKSKTPGQVKIKISKFNSTHKKNMTIPATVIYDRQPIYKTLLGV